jgi:hypothetical protein
MRLSNFNEMTKWSNLARLASGNLPKLTIIAPFLAFIIFHNEPLQPILKLSDTRHPNVLIEYLARARFDIFYLGLVIIGSGVAQFTLFCPRQITGYDGYEGYITFKEKTKTANGIAGSLKLTIAGFMKANQDADEMRDEDGGSLRYPRRFREGLISLVRAAARVANSSESVGTGHVQLESDTDLHQVLKSLDTNSSEEAKVRFKIFDSLGPFSIDVFRIEYLTADYSRPGARTLAFCLIAFGTAIVLIPTLITTFLVISDLFTVDGGFDVSLAPNN